MLKPFQWTSVAPRIDFHCNPADFGVIAEPVPAKTVLPSWFRRIQAVDKAEQSATNNALTIKRCMPFLDAMTTGWVLPLAADVRLDIRDEGRTVDAGWEFDKVMVSPHGMYQVKGYDFGERPPMKFHNYWTIRTPPGWSCLFTPLLNRPNPSFEILSGVVDTDTYYSLINFPFVATAADGLLELPKGTPLVQVIPFRRKDPAIPASIRPETARESEDRKRILRSTQSGEGWYRRFARAGR